MRKRRHRHGVGERVKVGLKAAAAAAVVLICFLMWLGQDGGIHNIYEEIVASIQGTPQTSRSVTVKRTDGSVEEMDLETYLLGVVGCEMPPSYELEALKAQAVAARTFVASRGYQVDDSTASQVYMDDTQLQAVWKDSYEESRSRVKEAVEATRGEIMTYEGEAITAFFFCEQRRTYRRFRGILQQCAALSAQRGISLGCRSRQRSCQHDDMHEGAL